MQLLNVQRPPFALQFHDHMTLCVYVHMCCLCLSSSSFLFALRHSACINALPLAHTSVSYVTLCVHVHMCSHLLTVQLLPFALRYSACLLPLAHASFHIWPFAYMCIRVFSFAYRPAPSFCITIFCVSNWAPAAWSVAMGTRICLVSVVRPLNACSPASMFQKSILVIINVVRKTSAYKQSVGKHTKKIAKSEICQKIIEKTTKTNHNIKEWKMSSSIFLEIDTQISY